MKKDFDIAIVGGGPAGSTAANLLSQAGLSVIILEKEQFPRPHVGESLLPFCYDIFQKLGVLEEMEKRFSRKPGAIFCDKNNDAATTYCFKHVVENPKHLSFHVRRDEFDLMLLETAETKGAVVCQNTRVLNTNLNEDIATLNCKSEKGSFDIRCKFVLDASGRDGLIARQNNWRTPSPDLDRIAFHSYWTFKTTPTDIKLGMIRIIYLDDEKKGWIWCIPVAEDKISIGLVVDQKSLGQERKKYKGSNWQQDFYMHEIFSSNYLKSELADAERDDKIWVNGDYSYSSKTKYGTNFSMIGDSGQFIDPIFSSGVFIAMKSAELVAEVLPNYLNSSDIKILDKVYSTISDGYETVGELINLYYNPNILDFSSVGNHNDINNERYDEFKSAYSLLHYLLAGDFFERGHIYKNFFKELKDGRKFERWQNLVNWESNESGVFYSKNENCL
ncbi:MAG: FAD-dependent oxidoreductase [Saprospiraceae bacterium]|nr:tryptophan 7-halogenase [Bacteroidia bacterium]NNL93266.1 FAD-dependent oxidoreductase [Saprospiraceae bacterium]